MNVWDCLERNWLPASQFGRGNLPTLEVYYNDLRLHGMKYWDMDCVLPIEKE